MKRKMIRKFPVSWQLPKGFHKKYKFFVLIIVALSLFTIGTLIVNRFTDYKEKNKTVFVIDGKKYSKSKVDNLSLYSVEIYKTDKTEASKNLFESIKKINAADKAKLQLSDKDVQAKV